MSTKICFKCEVEKDLNEFYKHSGMLDGRLNKCKSCAKNDVANHRSLNIHKVREYDRNRPNHVARAERHNERMKLLKEKDPDKYKQIISSSSDWGKKNRHKRNAHNKSRRAVINGNIKKSSSCEHCSSETKLEGHHPDYDRPTYVIWLCKKCHGLEHKRINQLKRDKT